MRIQWLLKHPVVKKKKKKKKKSYKVFSHLFIFKT